MILEIRNQDSQQNIDYYGAAIRLNGLDIDDAVIVVKSIASPRLEDILYTLDIDAETAKEVPHNLVFRNLDNHLREVLGKRKKFETTRARLQSMIGSLDSVIAFDPFDKNGSNKEQSENLKLMKRRKDQAERKIDTQIVEQKLKEKAKQTKNTGIVDLLKEKADAFPVEPENDRNMLLAHLSNWMGYQQDNKKEIFKNVQHNIQKQLLRMEAQKIKNQNKLPDRGLRPNHSRTAQAHAHASFLPLRANSPHMQSSRDHILKLGKSGLTVNRLKNDVVINPYSGKTLPVQSRVPTGLAGLVSNHKVLSLNAPRPHVILNRRARQADTSFNPYLVGNSGPQ